MESQAMSEYERCPDCGAELPTGATAGLCPKCLLSAGLEGSDDAAAAVSPFAATTPQPGGFVPPTAASLAPHFPQLEIIELLGHGGMGAVYKARQTKLDRFVALKVIRPGSADDPAFAERFTREARTLARLGHPHIVAVHDFGEITSDRESEAPAEPHVGTAEPRPPRALYYFVMEYIDGANLRDLMQSGALHAEQALAIVPQICDALQYAHDEGIVHRDIKPENILLDRRGRVKIADFGLAKLASAAPENFTLTGTHQVMGTPRYMAPEQMEGSHLVDHRADIYSLGVVFRRQRFSAVVRWGRHDGGGAGRHRTERTDLARRMAHAVAGRTSTGAAGRHPRSADRAVGADRAQSPRREGRVCDGRICGCVSDRWNAAPSSPCGPGLGDAHPRAGGERRTPGRLHGLRPAGARAHQQDL
jgi:predicted Ser/Thr protein kinase